MDQMSLSFLVSLILRASASLRDMIVPSIQQRGGGPAEALSFDEHSEFDGVLWECVLRQSIHAAGDSVFDNGFPEVQEVSQLQTGEPEIGLNLFLVRRQDPLDGLQFQKHLLLNDNIGTESFIESNSFIQDWNRDLPFDLQTEIRQFPREDHLINSLQKSWPKLPVHIDRGLKHFRANIVLVHSNGILYVSASLREFVFLEKPGSCESIAIRLAAAAPGDPHVIQLEGNLYRKRATPLSQRRDCLRCEATPIYSSSLLHADRGLKHVDRCRSLPQSIILRASASLRAYDLTEKLYNGDSIADRLAASLLSRSQAAALERAEPVGFVFYRTEIFKRT